jgi:uncharacterized protein (DUF1697 family)
MPLRRVSTTPAGAGVLRLAMKEEAGETPALHGLASMLKPQCCANRSGMTRYIALLRAVNVGGTGKLPMADLRTLCEDSGFTRVETYIASGNVLFESEATASKVRSELEARLLAYARKPVGVVVRTGREMQAVLKANPFADGEPNHTYAIFLNHRPPQDALDQVTGQRDETLILGNREIFVRYPSGMGRSKLTIPAAKTGTARNMTTVAKLAEMAAKP